MYPSSIAELFVCLSEPGDTPAIPNAAHHGLINHEIEIGKNDIKSAREAIQAYIEAAKIEGCIPSFAVKTKNEVFTFLAQEDIKKNEKVLSEEYHKATQVVMNRQERLLKVNANELTPPTEKPPSAKPKNR